jgi:hypothetical protein
MPATRNARRVRAESVLAVDATPIQVRAHASIGRNLLGNRGECLCSIGALIALDGTLGLGRQIAIRVRLGATGALDDVEFCLREVHERTLAHETPCTANGLFDYCITLRDLVVVLVEIPR